MKLKFVLPVLALAAAGAAFWPAAGGAATFKGIVVAKEHGTLLVTSPSGVVRAVSGRAAVGSRVAVTGRTATVVGRAHVARVRGIVVRRVGATMFLSSNRHLVAVRTGRAPASANDTPPSPPAPGTVVSSQVTIENGELDEDDVDVVGQTNASSLQVQAVVAAVGPGAAALTPRPQTLTGALPARPTLPASVGRPTGPA